MACFDFEPTTLDPDLITRRRMRIAGTVISSTAVAALLMFELHHRTGFDGWKALHLLLFTTLFAHLVFGAVQAVTGFVLRRRGGDAWQITRSVPPEDRGPLRAPTAVIMPICNEDVSRVMEGMRAIYESVRRDQQLTDCDFFLLSDSPDPNRWVEEEAAWLALTEELGAHGRLFYRKRRVGTNKKAGNVADFCRRWGSHYRYMVVLDADSIMAGEAIAQLVRLMERNPKVGLIQAVPLLVNGETLFARVQQFASRLYGTVFAAGLNYWQLGESNYWGHNAIIRVRPFIQHCALPELPGDGPFGGRILSHDYVEAALMRRAGWQVWLATDLPNNYEECPANLIDFAKRDRRWLQGNLQHTPLIFARGFHAVNRLHFTLGILSYLASPLWLAFVTLSLVIAHRQGPGAAGLPTAGAGGHALPFAVALFIATLVLLFLPKVLALLDLQRRPAELAAYGGWRKLTLGIVMETVTFTLAAPILMLFHTKFVLLTLCRRTISWGTQRRGRAGESAWRDALSAHTGQTLFGLVLAVIAFRTSPAVAWWLSPLLAGLIFSIPISYVTGCASIGLRLRAAGILVTPEEAQPGRELEELNAALARPSRGRQPTPDLEPHYGLLQAVLDPYINAVHVSLLRAKDDRAAGSADRFQALRDSLLQSGPGALSRPDCVALLSDLDSMVALHEVVWSSPSSRLGRWWQLALEHYQVLAPPPQTAMTR
jgi:membrane glycosyltransferase